MKDYSGIIQDIKDNITENGKGEITGRDLREILLEAIGNVSVDMGELDRRIEAILGGENYDDIINSWAELEQFLSGLDESSNLAELLSYKADKSDVYSRSDINTKLEDYTKTDDLGALALKDEVEMSDIKNLEDALDKKLDKEGGEIENNLLVKRELKMGVLFVPTSDGEPSSYRLAIGELGEGADIPSSGEGSLGSVTIMLGDVPYYSDSNGIVRLPAYPTGGGSADSVEWSAVLNKPTTLAGYGITDALSTSGGTIEGPAGALKIKRNGPYLSLIGFSNTDGDLGSLGFVWANNPSFFHTDGNYYPLIHSGNIGSYALKTDGSNYMSADSYIRWATAEGAEDYSVYNDGFRILSYNAATNNYKGGISVGTRYGWQLVRDGYNNTMQVRFRVVDTSTWNIWKTIAFTDSNVASATKLQTARTIWGQSFDGTGDIGVTTIGRMRYLEFTNADGSGNIGYIGRGSNTVNTVYLNSYDNPLSVTTNNGGIYINKNGNVGIGTTEPKSKLQVNGNIYASGYQLPTSAPSNPVSGGYYLYVGTLGAGATIS